MPVLSKFYGIVIRMYFKQSEHNPPHVHAKYGAYGAVISIQTGEVLDGNLPAKALELVRLWMQLHQGELMTVWDTQEFTKIAPLE